MLRDDILCSYRDEVHVRSAASLMKARRRGSPFIRAVRWISGVAAAVALVFVASIAVADARQWVLGAQRFAVLGLAVALVCAVVTLFTLALAWAWVLNQLGVRVELRQALYTWLMSNLYKYIPGQIWMPVGRTVLGARFGVPAGATVVTTIAEQIFGVLASGLVLAVGLRKTWAIVILCLLCLAALHPRLVNGALAVSDRASGRSVRLLRLRTPQLLVLWLVSWVNIALGLAALAGGLWAVGALDVSHARMYAVAMTASFLSGYFFFGAPAGLGVREGVMLVLLARSGVSHAESAAVPIMLRLISVIAEVLCFALVAASLRFRGQGAAMIEAAPCDQTAEG